MGFRELIGMMAFAEAMTPVPTLVNMIPKPTSGRDSGLRMSEKDWKRRQKRNKMQRQSRKINRQRAK